MFSSSPITMSLPVFTEIRFWHFLALKKSCQHFFNKVWKHRLYHFQITDWICSRNLTSLLIRDLNYANKRFEFCTSWGIFRVLCDFFISAFIHFFISEFTLIAFVNFFTRLITAIVLVFIIILQKFLTFLKICLD